mmetsp:Transcript_76841/g.197883  ORF Transcript_76841/g.197883 Transcript_76841/m.197883 type:complete len:215 (-) Transcript_76841:72-716(-)
MSWGQSRQRCLHYKQSLPWRRSRGHEVWPQLPRCRRGAHAKCCSQESTRAKSSHAPAACCVAPSTHGIWQLRLQSQDSLPPTTTTVGAKVPEASFWPISDTSWEEPRQKSASRSPRLTLYSMISPRTPHEKASPSAELASKSPHEALTCFAAPAGSGPVHQLMLRLALLATRSSPAQVSKPDAPFLNMMLTCSASEASDSARIACNSAEPSCST